jgi:signal transduction histidine kinase
MRSSVRTMTGMTVGLSSTTPPHVEGGEARRTRELGTLYRVAHEVAESFSAHEVLERSLRALVDMGWFACGEALGREGDAITTVAVGRCAFGSVDACPLHADLVSRAPALMEAGVLVHEGVWRYVPVGHTGLLALAGGDDVSPSFLAAVAELVRSALWRTALHVRLAEKEQQRSKLLQALLTAQEEERGRISRELHDQIGQALTALVLGLERSLESNDTSGLARLKELASITLADVRRIALDLRPSVLDQLGLEAAIRRYARDMLDRYGVEVTGLVTLPTRLDRQEETVLYRVAQEALTNVVRHAQASAVSVVVTASKGTVQLVVEDDGVGFDPASLTRVEQLGILGMRERLELLGGGLRIESAPGAGCRVYARLPLR